jgi:Tfp pilus assembly protein PilF
MPVIANVGRAVFILNAMGCRESNIDEGGRSQMRLSGVLLLIVISTLVVFQACKSVETTSAMIDYETGLFEKSIRNAKMAIEKNPNDATAYEYMALSYSQLDSMSLAYEAFQMAAKLDPKKLGDVENNIKSNWAKHYNKGLGEFQSGNLEGAANEFALTTKADPRQVKGWLNLAKVYNNLSLDDSTYLQKAFDTVDTLMTKVTQNDEEYGDALALSGRVMIRRGDREQAMEIFEKLMFDDPANFEIVEEVGYDFSRNQEWNDAVMFLEMAADGRRKTESESFELYYNMGVIYFNTKDFMKAIDVLQEALRLQPGDKQATYSLLLTYYQAELYDEAVMLGQEYTTGIAPDDPAGWQILSRSFSKKGMKIKAEEAFQKYRELSQ